MLKKNIKNMPVMTGYKARKEGLKLRYIDKVIPNRRDLYPPEYLSDITPINLP